MAVIGSLGDIIFSVSSSQVITFNNFKWDTAAKYAVHNRHMRDALVEYIGADVERISFTVSFSVFLGVDPASELKKLMEAERNGYTLRLVLGDEVYGVNKWVIEKTSRELVRFDNAGNLLTAKVSVSLISYANR